MRSAPPTADLVADLLLRFYREPLRYRELLRRAEGALGDRTLVLKLAAGRSVELADPALLAQGEESVRRELRRAAVFYIQQMFFRPDATHYEVLGVARDASLDRLRENFRLLMQLVHPDREDDCWPASFAVRVNAAYGVLKNSEERRRYDAKLLARTAPSPLPYAVPSRWWRPTGGARPTYRLPPWLTARVGGWIRRQPGLAALCGLTVLSVVLLLCVADEEGEGPVLRVDAASTPQPAAPPRVVAPSTLAPTPTGHRDAGTTLRADEPRTSSRSGRARELAAPQAPKAKEPKGVRDSQRLRSTTPLDAQAQGDAERRPARAGTPSRPPSAPAALSIDDTLRRDGAVRAREFAMHPSRAAAPSSVSSPAAEPPLSAAELDAMIANFVAAHRDGRTENLALALDDNAQTNVHRGRPVFRRLLHDVRE